MNEKKIEAGAVGIYWHDTGLGKHGGFQPIKCEIVRVTRCFAVVKDEFGNQARKSLDWVRREVTFKKVNW